MRIFARSFVNMRDANAFSCRMGVAFTDGGIVKNDNEIIDVLEYIDGFIKHDGVNFVDCRQVFFAELQCASFVV